MSTSVPTSWSLSVNALPSQVRASNENRLGIANHPQEWLINPRNCLMGTNRNVIFRLLHCRILYIVESSCRIQSLPHDHKDWPIKLPNGRCCEINKKKSKFQISNDFNSPLSVVWKFWSYRIGQAIKAIERWQSYKCLWRFCRDFLQDFLCRFLWRFFFIWRFLLGFSSDFHSRFRGSYFIS